MEKVLDYKSRLIGNRVQITNCRATVSNAKSFYPIGPLFAMTNGKDDKNVTSQETCLCQLDNAFAV